ncbi:MAG: phosphoadenosine phosphosulfate reductase [Mucilaginibacter sp.]|nr:phosphoadenosine phosphosulfate reductase [Mucilaginibacter sp.]
MTDSIDLTIQSIKAYGDKYKHWCIAWSGGKDSSTVVTLIAWLIDTGKINKPETLTVMYADTRMELTPLQIAAFDIMDELREKGIEVRTAMAPIADRFLVYILGRGVPPPTNRFRWCTGQIKIEPMEAELNRLFKEKGEKVLMITGVREGESAVRDQRIRTSCSKDGSECGQGWYQTTMPESLCDTLAPIIHWRVCHIWEWLKHWAPLVEYGDFSTAAIADAYGGDEAEEINARTGCIGCPLASKDKALDTICKMPKYYYLKPLKRLKILYRTLRLGTYRLRKTGLEAGAKNRQRMGPLTMSARKMAFDEVMSIQTEINTVAINEGRSTIDILNIEEQLFIQKCWDENLWPNGWIGDEPLGDVPMDKIYPDGSVQPLIKFGE